MAAVMESSTVLPRSELPEVHQALPAIKPYLSTLAHDQPPQFSQVKELSIPDSSASVRAAFGLLALLYLICEPEEKMPTFARPWEEWEERQRRQTRHAALETAILRFWSEFQEDESEKDLEEVLWTEFLVDGDGDKVLRVVDFLPSPRVPTALLCEGSLEVAMHRAWYDGVPVRCRVLASTEPHALQRYDSFTTPRVMHAISLGIQFVYILSILNYVLWPERMTIYRTSTENGNGDTGGEIDYINGPREVFIVVFALSDLMCFPILRPQAFASLLAFLSSIFFPEYPEAEDIPLCTAAPLAHLAHIQSALRPSDTGIVDVSNSHYASAYTLPPPYHAGPATCILVLPTGHPWIVPVTTFKMMVSPEETRVTSVVILFMGVAMLFYLIHGVASIFPTIIATQQAREPHTPVSAWDKYGLEVGVVARRAFVTSLAQYSEPYWFPPTVRIIMRVFVAPPVLFIRLLGKRDMSLRVRDGVQALLWRAMIAPAGVVLWTLLSWLSPRS
ncbi:hypothetical protein BKA62DRAFT_765614 [Auriculariales sp. MPI-PUGE-AT-0066]|nr:hypothetical protein BKA62DRAFT_765614 [Auriculariales sp. MPI-PUGE-AT-0066]